MRVHKEVEFDMGHRVPAHNSKCKHPHGHRYKVRAVLAGTTVPDDMQVNDSGMLMDFGHIKDILMVNVHDKYDHAFIYQQGDPIGRAMLDSAREAGLMDPRIFSVDFIPTAENLAKQIFRDCYPLFESKYGNLLRLEEIIIWETPTSVAYYGVEDFLDDSRD